MGLNLTLSRMVDIVIIESQLIKSNDRRYSAKIFGNKIGNFFCRNLVVNSTFVLAHSTCSGAIPIIDFLAPALLSILYL